jgi:pilus assembly protein Flp/PilA
MKRFVHNFASFLKKEDGPTSVEYAVMLALVVVVCITAITVLGRTSRRDYRVVGRTLAAS